MLPVSIIVVDYRSGDLVRRCLAPLQGQAELIVVNNGTPGASDTAASAVGATVLEAGGNVGFGVASNLGAARATQRHLLFLNPDVELGAPTLEAMVAALKGRPERVAVGPKHFEADGRFQPSFGGNAGFADEAERWFKQRSAERGWWKGPARSCDVGWLSASCLLVKRGAFASIGGFDFRFFLYFEDVDLGLRLGRLGTLHWLQEYSVVHRRGTSSAEASETIQGLYRESQRRFVDKHWSKWAAAGWGAYLSWRG